MLTVLAGRPLLVGGVYVCMCLWGNVWTTHHGELGEAGHGAVHGVLREEAAVDRVGGIGGHGAHHVGRVDVLNGGRQAVLLEVLADGVLEELADGRQLLVPARVWRQ